MKRTQEVPKITRSAAVFGPIQIKVKKGKIVTTDTGLEARFSTFEGEEVILMNAQEFRKLQMRLWEQHHLMLVA